MINVLVPSGGSGCSVASAKLSASEERVDAWMHFGVAVSNFVSVVLTGGEQHGVALHLLLDLYLMLVRSTTSLLS